MVGIGHPLARSLRSALRGARLVARVPRYVGFRFKCPICGWRFRRLLPRGLKHDVLSDARVVGAGYRENCTCPICGSTDRDRLVFEYLARHTATFREPTRVLHIAPEPSLQRAFLRAPKVNYVSGDWNSRLAAIRLDVTDLPFRDGWFDLIVCNHVLEHVPNDATAVRELFRVLVPGGRAILQVPYSPVRNHTDEDPAASPDERARRFGQSDHVRLYGLDYPDRLGSTGFVVEEFQFVKTHGPELAADLALPLDETLFVGRRLS